MTPYTPEALFLAYRPLASLRALVGDFSGCRALRVLTRVWETAPAFFPELAEQLVSGECPRAVCWNAAALLAEVPGAWPAYRDARDSAMLQEKLDPLHLRET